jgi:hypothetical protein
VSGAATHVRQLRAGQPLPAGARLAGTYKNADGYVRHRYQVGLRQYVERYVHREQAKPTGNQEVDHRNRNRADNRAANLSKLSPSRHATVGNLRRRYGR